MASVYLKRGTWYANFKDATGRRRNVATKATTKTEARRSQRPPLGPGRMEAGADGEEGSRAR